MLLSSQIVFEAGIRFNLLTVSDTDIIGVRRLLATNAADWANCLDAR